MNGEKARMLEVGDHVTWTRAAAPPLGKVVELDRFGVTIEWSDCNTSRMFFNDMRFVEKAWS
jgi:hypothetical protein